MAGRFRVLSGKADSEGSGTALPSIDAAQWIPSVRETDALLVGGGDPLFLAHWLQQSGAADVLRSLEDTVWVGVSAGNLVTAPHLSQDLSDRQSPTGSVEALGLVDFGVSVLSSRSGGCRHLPETRTDATGPWPNGRRSTTRATRG